MAEDVAGVVTNLKLGLVHMGGNDFGNRVARMFADASHPELTRSVILLAAGWKDSPKPAADRALMTIFNPKSTDAEILEIMPYMVSKPENSARVWAIFKPSRAPGAAGIERTAAEATPLKDCVGASGKNQVSHLAGSRRSNRASRKWRGA